MNMTLHELGFATGILCFGAVIGGWIVYRHVETAMRHLARQHVPSPRPVYTPDQRAEFTEADREALSRKVSLQDADTLDTFREMNAEAEPETVRITDAPPSTAWVNDRGTVIHPRAETRRRDERGRFAAREPDAVIAPGTPPPFKPDLPDPQRAARADWDAIAAGEPPEVVAARLAVEHFGADYSKRALAGSRS